MINNLVPLIKKAKTGDESAMSVLYESFKPLLLSNSIDPSKKNESWLLSRIVSSIYSRGESFWFREVFKKIK